MTKLTTEITIEELQYRIHAHENDLTQMWTADYFLNVQKELLASKQSAKNSADLKTLVIREIVDFYAGFESPGEPETVDEAQRQLIGRVEKVFGLAAPALPKQPESRNEIMAKGVEAFAKDWKGSARYSRISEMACNFAAKLRNGDADEC